VLRFDERELRIDYRAVPYIDRPGAPVSTVASYVVEAGNPGLQEI
jgi:alkaline phosphatase D